MAPINLRGTCRSDVRDDPSRAFPLAPGGAHLRAHANASSGWPWGHRRRRAVCKRPRPRSRGGDHGSNQARYRRPTADSPRIARTASRSTCSLVSARCRPTLPAAERKLARTVVFVARLARATDTSTSSPSTTAGYGSSPLMTSRGAMAQSCRSSFRTRRSCVRGSSPLRLALLRGRRQAEAARRPRRPIGHLRIPRL